MTPAHHPDIDILDPDRARLEALVRAVGLSTALAVLQHVFEHGLHPANRDKSLLLYMPDNPDTHPPTIGKVPGTCLQLCPAGYDYATDIGYWRLEYPHTHPSTPRDEATADTEHATAHLRANGWLHRATARVHAATQTGHVPVTDVWSHPAFTC